MIPQAWFLVGPTATGKTAVAHGLARAHGFEILSADAMLVYRGLDIGTAKPTPAERTEFRYHGIDLVDPDQPFSVGQYLLHAREAFASCAARGGRMLVVGGTGLYAEALRQGLDSTPAPDPARRAHWTGRLACEGVDALRAEAERQSPGILGRMPDSRNPRRLVRVLERLGQGLDPLPRTGDPNATPVPIPALHVEPALLAGRIARRVDAMFAAGLLEETRALAARFPTWSPTAGAAIGYAEALAVLRGDLPEAEARERIAARTRQLAKRQRTWYRHRTSVVWIDGPGDDAEVPRAAAAVADTWRKHGPCPVLGIADHPTPCGA